MTPRLSLHTCNERALSFAAFVEMIRDPVYREAVKHRRAGVEDSRLIRHAVLPVGKTFGEIPT
jgi:hypothetical protein